MKLPFLAALPLLALSLPVLAACSQTGMSAPVPTPSVQTVEVNATYRERIALPPGHILKVSIQDVSLADAPAVTLNEVSIPLDGRTPPYSFNLEVPASAIQQNHRYAARAEIRDSTGNLRFTTDTHHGVLTMGQPNTANIVMIGVQ